MPKIKPEPVPVSLVCSLCGQDWGKHGDDPTLLTCIEVLRTELARRPQSTWTNQTFHGGLIAGNATTGYLVGEHGPETVTSTAVSSVVPFQRRDDDDGSAGVRVPA